MRTTFLRILLVTLAVALAASLRPSQPASAFFHVALIDEVMSGFDGDPNVQYVEIEQLSGSQNFVKGTRLTAFDADGGFRAVLLQIPGNVPNSGNGVAWIIGTAAFQDASGISADFTFDPKAPALLGGIPQSGMLCWGAPGSSAQNPPAWDETNPNFYTDCVGYGGFTGANPFSAVPTLLGPGDCADSLQRVGDTASDLDDFVLAGPSPENNAGQLGSLVATDADGDGEADCRETDGDSDGDGVPDASDNCPLDANPAQTDADADGAGAACDPDDTIVDFDEDGCADGEELGPDESLGGRRNPTNPWDFYDVNGDQTINVFDDILAVAEAFGPDTGINYAPEKDRSPPPPPGKEPNDPRNNEPWDLGPPDGVINVFDDVLGVANQFGHNCAAPP